MWRGICLGFLIVLSACAELSKRKVAADGYYHFPRDSFAVWAPQSCLLDLFVQERAGSVTFTTGRGYWMASGEYSLTLIPLSGRPGPAAFLAESARQYQALMSRHGRRIVSTEESVIAGRPAFTGQSTDDDQDTQVHTHILFGDRIAVAALRYPLVDPQGRRGHLPRDCYQRFVDSITSAPDGGAA